MIVHNLQKLIEDKKPKARIAEKSGNQFTAGDIHVEVTYHAILIIIIIMSIILCYPLHA